ncbi:hypothetical protein CEXT_171361 [Caerostris extrusa]|uniref:Uncharacterized protein n=1 Tax=Caerostris extrusa TaxID=172846 RepID=A0AAV4Y3F5_CAEEX|nr:hypothetical protein CEXT_171361 [Caerostris extrusa]
MVDQAPICRIEGDEDDALNLTLEHEDNFNVWTVLPEQVPPRRDVISLRSGRILDLPCRYELAVPPLLLVNARITQPRGSWFCGVAESARFPDTGPSKSNLCQAEPYNRRILCTKLRLSDEFAFNLPSVLTKLTLASTAGVSPNWHKAGACLQGPATTLHPLWLPIWDCAYCQYFACIQQFSFVEK